MENLKLSIGKVPIEILNKTVFNNKNKSDVKREEVIVRQSIGEDCAAVNIGNEFCILSSDPITGASENTGYLAVLINANDIWSSGGEVIGIMVTILLPPKSTDKELQKIMDGVYKAAGELNIEVLGGHTEVTDAVNRIVVSATIVGKTKNKKFIYSSEAELGQDVVVTKWVGIEGTLIMENNLNISDEGLKLENLLSIEKEAKIACDFGVTTMHDITEGGILGAAYEIAEASKVGIQINLDVAPILERTLQICNKYKINPYKLISSGSLIITTFNGIGLVAKLKSSGINATIVGKIVDKNKTYILDGKKYVLEEPTSDEIYSVIL
jgi:hydrogenase expression/formation protein HypE